MTVGTEEDEGVPVVDLVDCIDMEWGQLTEDEELSTSSSQHVILLVLHYSS